MPDYSIDLGFDLDSRPKDGYAGFLELACANGGLVSLDKLKKNGNIYFTVYDTSEGTNRGRATPTSLTVTFASADANTTGASPVSSSTLSFSAFHDRGTKNSRQFGNCPSWYAQSGNQVNTDHPTTFALVNVGGFFVTVELLVGYEDGSPPQPVTKQFGQDPRMNVDT